MSSGDDKDKWLSELELSTVFALLSDNGATEALYKVLPRNANSKNQVYMASDMSQLGKIPSGEITLHESTSRKGKGAEAVFRAPLEFFWIDKGGRQVLAPEAKLILYPQYPEVRFSGFLKGCPCAPASLYDKARRGQEPGRVLVLGVGNGRKVLGITLPPESPAAKQIQEYEGECAYGAFFLLPLRGLTKQDGYLELMRELCRIHRREWVPATRLDRNGVLVPCRSSNCNGNTLESLLGIRSNGYSKPDFMGWEVKARQVSDSANPGASVVTLFTPEPTAGVYFDEGVEVFLRRYGYPDTQGRAGRTNFGGIYRANHGGHPRTGLRLVLDGFDAESGKYSPAGAIRMLDRRDREAMAWSFVKLMDHWKLKHAHAAFVPAQQRLEPGRQYRFSKKILVGEGAEFGLFLSSVHDGKVYYDPGIKMVESGAGPTPTVKRRSQFRVGSKNVPGLYLSSRIVDASNEVAVI